MTQEEFNEIVNIAAIDAAEDTTNDFYTILEEMIGDFEQKLDTMLEFDEDIAVDSVEEIKTKYNEFADKLLEERIENEEEKSIEDKIEHNSFMITFVDKW